jgi:hypothetical protein
VSEPRDRGKGFEERLLVRLKAVVAERGAAAAGSGAPVATAPGPRRRRPLRLALAGAAVLAVAAVVLVVSSGGDSTSRAFAVQPLSGGGVAIKIYSLEDTDGLEEALKQAGIPAQIDWLAAQTTCRERKLKPATVKTSMGGRTGGFEVGGPAPALTIGVMSAAQYRHVSRGFMRRVRAGNASPGEIPNVSFDPKSFRPGQTLVIVGSPEPHGGDPEGGYRASVQVVEGPVEPCTPVPEAAGSIGAIQLPEGAEGSGGSAAAAAAVPGPGQLLFTKTKVVQAQTWEPGGRGTGPKDHPRHFTSRTPGPGGHVALVPTTKEVWTARDGKTRVRETLGEIEFLSPADQRLWEAAGSPPPFEYDPAEHHVKRDAAGRATKEYAGRSFRGRHAFANVPKLYRLPTEPEALRLAIEGRPPGSPPAAAASRNGRTTAERLLEILAEPTTSPALAAAAFGALGELPGVRHRGEVTDAAGRRGEALAVVDEGGFGRQVIFDPGAAKVLAESETVFGPPSTGNYGVPPGTPYRETAYLESRIVDPAHEPGPAG